MDATYPLLAVVEAHPDWGRALFMFVLLLGTALLGKIVTKIDMPEVLGEIAGGIALKAVGGAIIGSSLILAIPGDPFMSFVALLGALFLLFSVGLETSLLELKKVGPRAAAVAMIGVTIPFALAFAAAPLLFAGAVLSAYLFVAASLVATSVGITSAVFRTAGVMQSRMANTVLAAAVFDDILGLMVLAVVSAVADGGRVSVGLVSGLLAKALIFLVGSVVVGRLAAPQLSRFFSAIHTGSGMKLGVAISFMVVFAGLADVFGLEPIIGAFAAGALLEEVHFRSFEVPPVVKEMRAALAHNPSEESEASRIIDKHQEKHVEDLIKTFEYIFVPIFFVHVGTQINVGTLIKPSVLVSGAVLSIVGILGKLAAGLAAVKGERMATGWAMVPRGEVGLVFAAAGLSAGVLTDEMYASIILMVVVTTTAGVLAVRQTARRFQAVEPGVAAA
ncbi:cation:proton antiporter [Candidatus Parcubacteria bacterium]|nr:cation:proton antiporter [Candidatus Parcubacteria bacterium]